MNHSGRTGARRLTVVGLLTVPLVLAGGIWAGTAIGASSTQPSLEVLPKPTGLHYGQTVEVKGHHLPKGSGSVAATICGLEDGSGKVIPNPTADDCAGASEIGKLVVVKSWQSNGEFDTNYTLPASGQKFGKNARSCDSSRHCAIVVADANPSNPAYHVDEVIQFFDQHPFGSTASTTRPASSTTRPRPTTTSSRPITATTTPSSSTTSPARPQGFAAKGSLSVSAGPGGGSIEIAGVGSLDPPSGAGTPSRGLPRPTQSAANPIPAPVAQGLDAICTQLAAAVTKAGGDPSVLTAACSAIASGTGPQQLATALQNPTLLCVEGASLWQDDPQITDACDQAATALMPLTSQLAAALTPVLGSV